MIISKGKQSYKKKDLDTQIPVAVGATRISFMHTAQAGDTGIDLYAMSAPINAINAGFVQPDVQTLLSANIYQNRNNLNLTRNAVALVPFVDYVVLSSSKISFLTFVAAAGDVFYGSITPIVTSGLNVVSGQVTNTTGTLAVGATDFTVSVPFETNKYPSAQIGAVLVYRDGVLQMRNVGNVTASPSADGNYQEVPGANGMSTIIRFNSPSVISSSAIIVVSNGLLVNNPTDSLQSQIEAINTVSNNAYNKAMNVATSQILDSAVTEPKLATDAVTTSKIKDLNVTGIKIKDGEVSYSKLASDVTSKFGAGYIKNASAETDTSLWNRYLSNPAGAAPGTTLNLSGFTILWDRTTVTPLTGVASFLLTKNATNQQGQGVYQDFTVERADLGKVMTISFDYELRSGSLATGDLTVYIIQDPTGTPTVVQPAGHTIPGLATGVRGSHTATFQTSTSVQNYRLLIHVSTDKTSGNTAGYTGATVAFDSISVDRQARVYGAPITDWQSYNCIVTGSVSNPSVPIYAYYKRVGDSLQVSITSGAFTADGSGYYFFPIPTGLSIDTNKGVTFATNLSDAVKSWSGSIGSVIGTASIKCSSFFKTSGCSVYAANSTSVVVGIPGQSSTATENLDIIDILGSSNSMGSPAGQGMTVSMQFTVPIQGWGSTVELSSSTDTRVVAFIGRSPGQTLSSSNFLDFSTATLDTHGTSSGTGTSWKYIAPVSGVYDVKVFTTASVTYSAGNRTALELRKNGSTSTYAQMGVMRVSGSINVCEVTGVSLIKLDAGEYIQIYADISSTNQFYNNCTVFISRLSGPATVAASETVNAKYTSTTSTTISNNNLITLPFANKVFDSHSAFDGSTYTVPVSGKYRVSVAIACNSLNFSSTNFISATLYKGVNPDSQLFSWMAITAGAGNPTDKGYTILSCVAGDQLQIKITGGNGINNATLTGVAVQNYVCFERIGN